MSHSSGESMPVVDCTSNFPQCLIAAGRTSFRTAVAVLMITGVLACANAFAGGSYVPQESSSADPPASGPNGSAPAVQDVPAAAPPTANAADEYLKAILKQQDWARRVAMEFKPLLPENAEAEFNKISTEYRRVLQNGPNLSNARDAAIIQQALEFRIFRATDPANQSSPRTMSNILNELRRDLKSIGSQINNPQARQRYREEVLTIAHTLLLKLMDNNLDARVFAVSILPDLEVIAKSAGQNRIVILDLVPGTLASLQNDANQPDAVRVNVAVQSRRFLETTEALPVNQMKIANSLSTELSRKDTEAAYQLALVDALSFVAQPREVVGRSVPSVFESLKNVVCDRSRFITVRCRAASGLGRIGYDPQINFDPLAWKVAELATEVARYFNQSPGNPAFKTCGWDLYLAFHHANSDADETGGSNPKGMLNRAPRSQLVKDAYANTLKIILPLLQNTQAIPQAELAAVMDWAAQNVPANLLYDANGTPVTK